MADSTDVTAPETEVTATAGEQTTEQEVANQEDLATKVNELTTQLEEYKSLQGTIKELEEAKKKSDAEALRWQATYKGLQGSTTQKLQELAQLQKQTQANNVMGQELDGIKQMINVLIANTLDEQSAKALELQMRESQLRRQEEAARNSASQPTDQQLTNPQYDPDQLRQQKEAYLKGYFPGLADDIDPDDPRIDWANGAQNQAEAVARFTSSVSRIIYEPKPVETTAPLSVDELVKAQLEQFRTEQKAELEKLAQEREAAIEAAKEAARKEFEERARKMGIDTTSAPPPENQRKSNVALRELDDSLLTTPKGAQEYRRRLEELKKSGIR